MTRADDWAVIRDDSIAAFEAVDDGLQGAMAESYILRAIALQSGWTDPRVSTHLATLYGLRKADGGWGLQGKFDVFGDGTENPPPTTYTITDTDHVGAALLEAHAAGLAVPLSDIATLVDLTMTTQTFAFANGKSVAYSRSSNDAITATNNHDVHNVSAGAAWFLQQAQVAGVSYGGLNKRIVDLTRRLVAVYQASSSKGAWWPYRGPSSVSDSDTDHVSLVADLVYTSLCFPAGREVAYNVLASGHDDGPNARIGWARLAGLPPGPGAVLGDTTLWLVLADQWMGEIADFGVSATAPRRAQIAYWAARAAAQAAVVL